MTLEEHWEKYLKEEVILETSEMTLKSFLHDLNDMIEHAFKAGYLVRIKEEKENVVVHNSEMESEDDK
jgi:hypothetical protein